MLRSLDNYQFNLNIKFLLLIFKWLDIISNYVDWWDLRNVHNFPLVIKNHAYFQILEVHQFFSILNSLCLFDYRYLEWNSLAAYFLETGMWERWLSGVFPTMLVGLCYWQMGRALEILGATVEAARVLEPAVGLPRPVSQETW